MLQKRRVPRRAIHARVGLLVRGRYSICVTHEIGEGGILISSPEPLQVGDLVVLTFRLPNILNGVVMGRVAYTLNGDGLQGADLQGEGPQVEQAIALNGNEAPVVTSSPVTKVSEEKKYGIQFEKIDFDIKRHIRNYVASSNVAMTSKSTGS